MEYPADDFELALLAKGLGKTADYEKYLSRSRNWEKLWDPDFEDGGFKGSFVHAITMVAGSRTSQQCSTAPGEAIRSISG
jgi:putative alpha-1,2-mannosidase